MRALADDRGLNRRMAEWWTSEACSRRFRRDQRQTLRLFFIEGYTLDEIAAKLGQSRGNVKHHYFRGLDRLRKQIFGGKLPGKRAV